MRNSICTKCQELGISFKAKHLNSPIEYFEGNVNSEVWIIGLNPKTNENNHIENRTLEKLAILNPETKEGSYFKNFKNVSEKLYNNWCSPKSNIGHTDLVKCASSKFPPIINGKQLKGAEKKKMIENCSSYFEDQVTQYKPKLIICNGADTSHEIKKQFPPNTKKEPDVKVKLQYSHELNDGHKITIILSGFIGRIDNWSKRRLGVDIETVIKERNIKI